LLCLRSEPAVALTGSCIHSKLVPNSYSSHTKKRSNSYRTKAELSRRLGEDKGIAYNTWDESMKKSLLNFAAAITSTAIAASLYLASLENPTEIQKQLSTTTNAIAIAGTTAIFGLLDDDKETP